jgi:hypothetical protein
MQIYTENLKAGKPISLPTAGRVFLIDSITAGTGVDVTLMVNGAAAYIMPNRKTAFKCIVPFDGVQLKSAVDTTVVFFVSFDDVQIGLADGAGVNIPNGVVITNTGANPVPVAFSGTVTPVLGNVTVNNTDATAVPVAQKAGTAFDVTQKAGASFDTQVKNTDANAIPVRSQALTTIVNIAPVTVAAANTALISDATLKKLRIKNTHATANVAIGATGVTLASAAIVLAPGDMFIEDDAAGAAWFAISDTAGAVLAMQGLK